MISVIIPVLNEARSIGSLLAQLNREATPHEVIVVDGGSRDGTADLAGQICSRVVFSETGRGNQICRGAAEASGDVLLFLHADSVFPPGGLARILEILAIYPHAVGGNFSLVFDGDTRFSRGLTAFYGWIRRFGLYYGDSGIFVRRSVYDAIGGMLPIALMEDLDFVRRLEGSGKTYRIEDLPLVTSSRRFHGRPAGNIVFGWVKLHVLFWCGVTPERLAAIYATQQLKSCGRRAKNPAANWISNALTSRSERHPSGTMKSPGNLRSSGR